IQEPTFVPGYGDLTVWRVHGAVYESAKELKEFAKIFEKGKKVDHRTLGKEQELFVAGDVVSSGSYLWLPRGKILLDQLHHFWKNKILSLQAHEVSTPPLINTHVQTRLNPYLEASQAPSFEFEALGYTPTLHSDIFHAELFLSKPVSYKEMPYRT